MISIEVARPARRTNAATTEGYLLEHLRSAEAERSYTYGEIMERVDAARALGERVASMSKELAALIRAADGKAEPEQLVDYIADIVTDAFEAGGETFFKGPFIRDVAIEAVSRG